MYVKMILSSQYVDLSVHSISTRRTASYYSNAMCTEYYYKIKCHRIWHKRLWLVPISQNRSSYIVEWIEYAPGLLH